jgi:CRP/FNR family transcriptional regulator, anaerobic regulatory protein
MTADAILRSFEFYRLATPQQRDEYLTAATAVSLPAGAAFYRECDVCPHIAFVGRGDIRVFKEAAGGREITLYHVRDGEPCLINMLCVVLGCPATASSVAEAPTEAVVVPAAIIRKWITTDERIRSYVFETMAARLTEVMTLAVEISVSRMDARLASLLLRLVSVHADGILVLTHDELAAELGTAREVVSRLLKEFERVGAIRLARGHITVIDPPRLAGLSASAAARI